MIVKAILFGMAAFLAALLVAPKGQDDVAISAGVAIAIGFLIAFAVAIPD